MPTPTITDDDKGTITATVDSNMVRSWEYRSLGGRSYVMAQAREYAEGWHNCTNYLKSQLKTGETP